MLKPVSSYVLIFSFLHQRLEDRQTQASPPIALNRVDERRFFFSLIFCLSSIRTEECAVSGTVVDKKTESVRLKPQLLRAGS